uniref:Uncharacterized protein LOC107360098 n=1 Tax=Tetranychus evansi TaxID=178897 RepID=A0A3G5AR58_9ACAR|nr:uncharacterized protein LOC107360098 [Tetranychus evansi]
MRFAIVLALAMCLGLACGADLSRSKRDMQQEMQNIIQEIQKNGIGPALDRVQEFVKNFEDQIPKFPCPDINDFFHSMESRDPVKIATMLFEGAVCAAFNLYGRQ